MTFGQKRNILNVLVYSSELDVTYSYLFGLSDFRFRSKFILCLMSESTKNSDLYSVRIIVDVLFVLLF